MSKHKLEWRDVVSSFRIMPARDLLAMQEMGRHQNVKDKVHWLTTQEPPLVLLFISHRWETLQHPDPTGRQLRAIQELLRRLSTSVEAMMLFREDRLRLVPSLTYEGTLQAEEVARRMFGFGPFSDETARLGGKEEREIVRERFEFYRGDREAFQAWLTGRIGLWLDYTCMPQRPLSVEDESEFRRALGALDALVMSSTVLALRQAGDDYTGRGWCAAEYFLGSDHSFSRGLFIDVERLATGEKVPIPDPPVPSGAVLDHPGQVMMESYQQDLRAFQKACENWCLSEAPQLDVAPPDAWSSYRALQGSSFLGADQDPNPFRRVLEVIRNLETSLLDKWLMAEKSQTFDVGHEVGNLLHQHGLRCSDQSDLTYLGFLLARHGWIDAFRPFFRECLRKYLENVAEPVNKAAPGSVPRLLVTVEPVHGDLRALFTKVSPHSAGTWHLRLSSGHGSDPYENALIEQLRKGLDDKPLEFIFISAGAGPGQ